MKIISLILLLLFFACNSTGEQDNLPPTSKENIAPVPVLKNVLDLKKMAALLKDDGGLTLQAQEFYKLNQYQPVWLNNEAGLNEQGQELLILLKNARYFGLEPRYYNYARLDSLENELNRAHSLEEKMAKAAGLESLLTEKYFLFGKHLNVGLIKKIDTFSSLPRKSFSVNLPEYLKKAQDSDSVIPHLVRLQPQHFPYKELQKALEKYVLNTSLVRDKVAVPSRKTDSLGALSASRKALFIHQYLKDTTSEGRYLKALKEFQKDHGLHPDGVVGFNTAAALSRSPYEQYQSAAISLERLRWNPVWIKDFIYVNIASGHLWFVENGAVKSVHRVVVGSKGNNTPEVYSKLDHLVAYPFWHVPRSISVNEILVKAKKNPGYLARNNYEVIVDAKIVSPESIRWDTINDTNFKMHIRQKGGTGNSLGLVKFIFNNPYSIYLHDTPSKYHFEREVRTYSHGCIRVKDALVLADKILESDENVYTLDSVNHYVEIRKQKTLPINKNIAIYIQYVVCEGEDDGRIIFYQDVYRQDVAIKNHMFGQDFKPD
jgi:murein L,D-transpeptidase YcbB/YkuD